MFNCPRSNRLPRKSRQALLALLLSCAAALAQPITSHAPLGFEWANVLTPGAPLPPGAWSRTIRPFFSWMQICDEVRGGKRLCYLEAVGRAADAPVSFRIALAKDGRSMALAVLPANADRDAGVVISFGGLSKTVKPLICDAVACVATFPADAPFISVMARESALKIWFSRAGKPVEAELPLKGMDLALVDLSAGRRPRETAPSVARSRPTSRTGAKRPPGDAAAPSASN